MQKKGIFKEIVLPSIRFGSAEMVVRFSSEDGLKIK
jgi:hypothetical protein